MLTYRHVLILVLMEDALVQGQAQQIQQQQAPS